MRTPEWADLDVRVETAAQALAAGDVVLHDLLLAHNSSKLRKAQIFHICRLWRYASHVWRRRGNARHVLPVAGSMPATSHGPQLVVGAVPRAPSNPLVTGPALAQSMQLALASAMTPHVQRSLRHIQGVEAQRAAAFLDVVDLDARCRDAQHAAEMMSRVRLAVRSKRLALRDWANKASRQQTAGSGSDNSAWLHLSGGDGMAETLMRLLATAWGAGLQDSKRNEARLTGGGQLDLHPAVPRWFVEYRQGIQDSLEWLASAQALLAPFKCRDLTSYVIASDAIMEAIEQACREAGLALTARSAWIGAHLVEKARMAGQDPQAVGGSKLPKWHFWPEATQAAHHLFEFFGTEPEGGACHLGGK